MQHAGDGWGGGEEGLRVIGPREFQIAFAVGGEVQVRSSEVGVSGQAKERDDKGNQGPNRRPPTRVRNKIPPLSRDRIGSFSHPFFGLITAYPIVICSLLMNPHICFAEMSSFHR